MEKFSEQNAGPEMLYDWCMKEYNSRNPLTMLIISRFYEKIGKIIETIRPNIGNILEIGCGAGESSLRIMKLIPGIQYDASEFDTRYIEVIKKRGLPLNIYREDVYNINKPDSSYDCIIMLEVLEHLEDLNKAIAELFRVTRRYLIISVPDEPIWRIGNVIRGKYVNELGNTPGHINHFNRRSLNKLLSAYPLKINSYKSLPWLIVLAEKTC